VCYTDKLACLIDGKVEYHEPSHIEVTKSDSLLEFHSTQIDLRVTPNHNMWVKRQKGPWQKVPAQELVGPRTDLYFKKDFPWQEGKEIETVTIPSISWIVQARGRQFHHQLPALTFKTDDFLEFFGYFLSDGGALSHPKRRSEVYLTQIDDANFYKMVRVVERLGLKHTIKLHGNGKRIHVWCSQLNHYLIDMKRNGIPKAFKNLSKRQLRILLDAFYLGDGDKNSFGRIFTGIYPKLTDDLQEIVLKLGYSSNVHWRGRDFVTTIGIPNPHKFVTNNHPIKKIKGQFDVYCATVPGGLLFVRRNGLAAWCGNSGFYYREWSNPRYTRIRVPWQECPRISRESIESKRSIYGEAYVKQEYECEFLDDISSLFSEQALRESIDEGQDVLSDQMAMIDREIENGV